MESTPHPVGPRLAGKIAVVTGAGTAGEGFGTGRATAILFARHGARVALMDHVPAHAERTLEMIRAEGGDGFVFAGDVTREEDCAALVAATVERYGRLDILDNNVGIVRTGSVADMAMADWDQIMQTNLRAMVLTSRHAVPAMARAGGGAIVNISSIAAHRPFKVPGSVGGKLTSTTPYIVSKGAVETLTKAMAVDHGGDGIRVNCIAPGLLNTPRGAARHTPETIAARRGACPLGIEGTAWDVAWAAVYLASDEARYVSGIVLTVDGGNGAQGFGGNLP